MVIIELSLLDGSPLRWFCNRSIKNSARLADVSTCNLGRLPMLRRTTKCLVTRQNLYGENYTSNKVYLWFSSGTESKTAYLGDFHCDPLLKKLSINAEMALAVRNSRSVCDFCVQSVPSSHGYFVKVMEIRSAGMDLF